MAVISVEVPDKIARKVKKETITIETLYNYDEDVSSWKSVKVGEKASVVLDYLKKIR